MAHSADEPLVIGLVNNMPDGALQTTERQFKDLLSAATSSDAIQIRVFSFSETQRAPEYRSYIDAHYESIDSLWNARLDGLIVSGTEPRTPALADESYWKTLTRLVDWAADNTVSTLWSCLAAHAAVYHLDGVSRQRFPEKLSGVFDCTKVSAHPLLANTQAQWCIPHSRSNDLPEAALVNSGYEILSRSQLAGADMFVKQSKSLFVFLQGHPEYDQGSLLREYQRDVGRFLRGDRDEYPQMPRDYLETDAASAVLAFRARALAQRDMALLREFPSIDVETTSARTWRSAAVRIYANWLSLLRQGKTEAQAGVN